MEPGCIRSITCVVGFSRFLTPGPDEIGLPTATVPSGDWAVAGAVARGLNWIESMTGGSECTHRVKTKNGEMTMGRPIEGVRACVFDAYGTLFDFGSAAARCRDELGDKVAALTTLWRDKQLQYTWLRALQHRHADFWTVTGDALDYALETLGIGSRALRDRLMNLYSQLEAFPEVPATLKALKERGLVTAILSNGTPKMLEAAIQAAGLASVLDFALSVEEVGVFKPDPRVYQLAVDRLGVPATAISFQSSNAWDAYAASAFGMRVVWCNRYGQRGERLPGRPDAEIRSLAELPAALA